MPVFYRCLHTWGGTRGLEARDTPPIDASLNHHRNNTATSIATAIATTNGNDDSDDDRGDGSDDGCDDDSDEDDGLYHMYNTLGID